MAWSYQREEQQFQQIPEGRYRIVKHFSIYEKGGAEAERITLAQQFIIG